MIEVKELTKRYDRVIAADHISFSVEEGNIYGFLGPNGAGKTTILNMITGYLAPDSGQILIQGKDMGKEPENARRQIGYLPEIPPLYPDMTTEEYLDFAAGLKKIPRRARKEAVLSVMEKSGTTEVKKRLIRNLSKGYRQRVGLAQALLGDPELLILDEPMTGLDPQQIVEVRELICSLRKTHTIILSSHILSEINAVCDHILILSQGKLVGSGSPWELAKKIKENQRLELSVKGNADSLRNILQGLGKIREIRTCEPAAEGASRAVVYVGDDIREELFYALAEHRMPVLALAFMESSLEEIFLELTRNPEEAGHGDSIHRDSLHGDALPGKPMLEESKLGDSMHGEPMHGEPMPEESKLGDSMHGEPMHREPMPGDSMPGDSMHGDNRPEEKTGEQQAQIPSEAEKRRVSGQASGWTSS